MNSLAIPWLRAEDWSRWVSIDPDFHADYQSWLGRSQEIFKRYEAMGHTIVRVVIDPDEFLVWSGANVEGKIDYTARSAFAASKSMRMRKRTAKPTPVLRDVSIEAVTVERRRPFSPMRARSP
jgi:hypothetical protein